jgi:hypothetical protein
VIAIGQIELGGLSGLCSQQSAFPDLKESVRSM